MCESECIAELSQHSHSFRVQGLHLTLLFIRNNVVQAYKMPCFCPGLRCLAFVFTLHLTLLLSKHEMPCKRRKLDAEPLLGLRRVPLAIARKVLEAVPDIGGDYDRRNLRYDLDGAREKTLDDVLYIVDLPLTDGTDYKWYIGRPQSVLRKFANHSDALKRVIQNMPSSPDEPLDVLHYHDEVTAGNLLAPDHSRSFTSFRFSFQQMGKHLLSCEEMWFEYAILRSTVLDIVVGGMSAVMAKLMHIFFTCSSEGS